MFECLKDINTWLLYTTLHRDKFCAYLVFTPLWDVTPKKYAAYNKAAAELTELTQILSPSQYKDIPAPKSNRREGSNSKSKAIPEKPILYEQQMPLY